MPGTDANKAFPSHTRPFDLLLLKMLPQPSRMPLACLIEPTQLPRAARGDVCINIDYRERLDELSASSTNKLLNALI